MSEDVRVDSLDGSSWRLMSIGDQGVPAGVEITLEFRGADVSGFGGCNRYAASSAYNPATDSLSIGSIRSTRMACLDPAIGAIETAFLAALEATTAATIDGDHLVLHGPATRLAFARAGALGAAE